MCVCVRVCVCKRLCVCVCDSSFLTALQHINELTMKLDVLEVLRGAESIYMQLSQCRVSLDLQTYKPD